MDDININTSLVGDYGEDCGSFNLMTGFSAANDTNATADMSAVGEAIGDRNIAGTRDTSDMHPASKRSRIDKDGFVTPTTPNHSEHNHHYLDSESDLKIQSLTENDLQGGLGMDVERLASGPVESEDMGQLGRESAGPNQAGEVDDMDSLATSCTSLTQLLREFGQRAKMLNTDWSYAFSDSENFESFCVTRLDKMLEDAKALEADLIQQKEGLRQKLLDLSRTLQLD